MTKRDFPPHGPPTAFLFCQAGHNAANLDQRKGNDLHEAIQVKHNDGFCGVDGVLLAPMARVTIWNRKKTVITFSGPV